MFVNDHHGDGRLAIWCNASKDAQVAIVEADPRRFFVPPYVGPSGWIGIYLDQSPDWGEVRELLTDGYRLIAPKRLLATLTTPGRRGA